MLHLSRHLIEATGVLATADATADEQTKAKDALAAATVEYTKLAPLAERQAKWAEQSADDEIRKAEAAKLYNEQVQRLTGIIQSTRGGLEDLFAGGKVSDFFGTVRQNFIRLRAETTVESIFGSAFRDLDKAVRRNDPLNLEITNFAEQAGKGAGAIIDHANALISATAAINGRPAANDNLASESNPNGLILVEALRKTDVGLKPVTLNNFTRQAEATGWTHSFSDEILHYKRQDLGKFVLGVDWWRWQTLQVNIKSRDE